MNNIFKSTPRHPLAARPETLRLIREELQTAREKYPGAARNASVLDYVHSRLKTELELFDSGRISNATLFGTCVEIAALAIRVAEDGPGGIHRGYGEPHRFKLEE